MNSVGTSPNCVASVGDWCGHGTLNAPSALEAVAHNMFHTAKPCRPFSRCQALTVELQKHIPARVVALLSMRGPTAIARLIVAVVIDAINRVALGRPNAHVGDEVFEAVAPSVAYDDASTTVVSEFVCLQWTMAPRYHRVPDVVVGVIRQAMRGVCTAGRFVAMASTRNGRASGHSSSDNVADGSAVAPADPSCFSGEPIFVWRSSDDGPASKLLTRQVSESRHKRYFSTAKTHIAYGVSA